MEHLPSELKAEIARHVPTKKDLAHLARISKAWVHPAQSFIFRSIPHRVGFSSRSLLHTLQASPHLTHHTRQIALTLSVDDMQIAATLPFPLLSTCALHSSPMDPVTAANIIPPLRILLCRDTMRALAFHGHFLSPSLLNAVLSHSSRHIRHLNIAHLVFQTAQPSSYPISALHIPRKPLETLCISETTTACLASPDFPFDTRSLTNVFVPLFTDTSPFDHTRIINLCLTTPLCLPLPAIRHYPALTRLKIQASPNALPSLPDALAHLLALSSLTLVLNLSALFPDDPLMLWANPSMSTHLDAFQTALLVRRTKLVQLTLVPASGQLSAAQIRTVVTLLRPLATHLSLSVQERNTQCWFLDTGLFQ
ncbi:hypothetical protein DFH06DRAFT_1239457 [Mycena polygramma]|nr:hypothetical protein DFH06DRAFT_1239457 [Mycena polygramma]